MRHQDSSESTAGQSNATHPESGQHRVGRGRPDGPDGRPPVDPGAGSAPGTDRDSQQQDHAGYAEMNSERRKRLNEVSAQIDPEQAAWGSDVESHKANDRDTNRPEASPDSKP